MTNSSNLQQVHDHFEREAFRYDQLILKLIPQYREQNALLLDLIPFEPTAPLKVLDLGCGTGVLSYLILERFAHAHVRAFDLANAMLEACKTNVAERFGDRATFQLGNFADDDFGTDYDLIVSGLAIHHLDDASKQTLFQRLFGALKPGGVFLDRDLVTGSTPALTQQYNQLWQTFIAANGEDAAYWFSQSQSEDLPASVEQQLQWLHTAGFGEIGCHWRYLNFAIFGGRKAV
jgi:tRNA (cmo5U34)-methyltransferase